MTLNDSQLMRYSRNILLSDIDILGQEKLLSSSAMVIGLGGLGSPVASYLTASGVGKLVISDFDSVDISNLQRQTIFSSENIGENKAVAAKKRLLEMNPQIEIISLSELSSTEELRKWIRKVDIVADCTDNLSTRLLINEICFSEKTILVSGAAIKMEGQLMVINPNDPDSPCYACLYTTDEEIDNASCSESGVLGPLVGTVGCLQATEILKILLGIGSSSVGKLITMDGRHLEWLKLDLPKKLNCSTCKPKNG